MDTLFVFVLVMAIMSGPGLIAESQKNENQKNVLFIVVDDLRPALGCYDDPTFMKTPNIDNLAAKSVLFERAFTQQAICGPSRISFLTSRRPDTTRLYDFYSYWRVHAGNYTSLPQHFKQHGYITQSVGKVFHPGLASNFSDDSPYSWTNTPYHASTHKYKMSKVCPNSDGTLSMNIVCPVEVAKMPEKTLPDIQSADFAVNFLKNMSSSGSNQPFFLATGFHKPHIPLKYPREYLDLYPFSEVKLAKHHSHPLRMPLVAWNPWTDLRQRDDVKKLNISFPFGPVPENYQRLMRQSYYAATSYMDTQVGRVLAALEESGFADNTIVSFVGDHGWALGEHQEWSKYSLFTAASRVPLMMYIPGVTHSRQDRHESVFPYLSPFNYKISSMRHHNDEHFENESTYNGVKYKSPRMSDRRHFGKNQIEDDPQLAHQLQFSHIGPRYKSSAFVELVDMFPTLAEAVGIPKLPLCPENPFKVMLCTEGTSLIPLIKNIVHETNNNYTSSSSTTSTNTNIQQMHIDNDSQYDKDPIYIYAKECYPNFTVPAPESFRWKKAAFSQYPRPSVEPREDSDKPHLKKIKIMGYSMWTPAFHYTQWVKFCPKTYRIHWKEVYGTELYLVQSDPYEIDNLAPFERCSPLVSELSHRLRHGWRGALPPSTTATL